MSALAALGLCGEVGRSVPHTVVLNWANVDNISAEAAALFAVLVHTLAARGFSVIVCEPADGDVATALHGTGIRDELATSCGDVSWVPCAPGPMRRLRVLTPAVRFGAGLGKAAARSFVASVEAALPALMTDRARATLVTDAVSEVVLNVLTHAEAEDATAVMLLHHRRRPQVIEIGFADSGMGIARSILQQPRHAWLEPLSDRGATAAVFGAALSGRDADAGGGGMTRIMRRLATECNATVTIRSGTAKVVLRDAGKDSLTIMSHTYGWGTQTRIVIPTS